MGLSEQIAEDKLRHLPHKACSFGHPCTTRGFGGRDHEDAVHMARHMPGADPARSPGRGSPAPGCVGAPRPPARGTPGPSSQKPAMWPTRLNSATPSSRPLDPVNGTPSGRRASAGVTSGDEVTLRQGGPTPVTGGSMRRGRPGPPGKALRRAEQQGPSPGAPERAAEAAR